ncbi:MAG: hypothetical protein KAR13_13855 [Desulfobulbaceae bacterium]|nr:hypothetical protein [Desulfobulbaceae bacterium]
MNENKFCQFLIKRGFVNTEDIYEALNVQKNQKIPIGKIALKEKILSVKQVFKILNDQVDNPKLFGEIAIGLGYLNENDVALLLNIQRSIISPIVDILVDTGIISPENCDKFKEEFYQKTSQ